MYLLENYLEDGANYQARATLMFLQRDADIEESWNDEWKRYDAEIQVARWENCREQGYIISMRSKDYKRQINIAFFEHRNSDQICAVKWKQCSTNSLTIETADFGGEVYKDKWDTSFGVGYGEITKMAEWIEEQLEEFWEETK